MTYTRCWRATWSVLGALGVGVAALEWSPTTAAACVLLFTSCAAVAQVLLWGSREADGRRTPSWLDLGTSSLWIGAVVTGELAVTEGSASLGLLVLLVAVSSAPPVVRRLGARGAGAPAPVATVVRPEPDRTTPRPLDVTLETLTDTELCQLWRGTFWELTRTVVDPDDLLAMVAVRQACLDEMERRNPEAVRAWLDSGARASGGPEKYWPPTGSTDAA
jgi:hypothetical protein